MSPPRTIRSWRGITTLEGGAWDSLLGEDTPFLRHGFLASLEDTGCVGPGTGWTSLPITAHDGERLVGACPCYLKTHSMGEFVYDWAWADGAARAGLPYYPKLVVGVPFTPVTGRRLLTDPSLDPDVAADVRLELLQGVVALAEASDATGVHLLFCTPQERDLAVSQGWTHRLGMQLHWRNEAYEDFDMFLARFRAKRRKEVRRERRRLEAANVRVRSLRGDALDHSYIDHAFRFYGATVDKFAWGRRYLSRPFFEQLWRRMHDALHLVVAERDGEVVGGALSLEAHGRRYGRYWGADQDLEFLHFEVCAYAQIEDCIARGIQTFEAGSGVALHKYNRGFLPALTHSAHLCFDPNLMGGITRFCRQEALAVTAQAAGLERDLFVR